MTKQNIAVSIGVSLLVSLTVVFFFPNTVNTVVKEVQTKVGAFSGPDVSVRMAFGAGFTSGGYSATSSTAGTYTTAARDFAGLPTVIAWTPNVNTTVTLASTSLYQFVPKVGDVANVYLLNASTTAAASITLAAGTGVDLQMAEATGGDLVLTGLDWEKLTLIRKSTSVVTVIADEMTEAD
jgi:hypothetical protein